MHALITNLCPYSFLLENIGPAAAGPAGPVPMPMKLMASRFGRLQGVGVACQSGSRAGMA